MIEVAFNTVKLTTTLKVLAQAYPAAAAQALYEEGEKSMTAAKRITPWLTGTLRASGYVKPPERTSGSMFGIVKTIVVTLGFGGASAPYAVYVHENLRAKHKAPTQAKFLEATMLQRRTGLTARLGRRIQELVRAATR